MKRLWRDLQSFFDGMEKNGYPLIAYGYRFTDIWDSLVCWLLVVLLFPVYRRITVSSKLATPLR